MDDKTLVEKTTDKGYFTFWDSEAGESRFTFAREFGELFEHGDNYPAPPIAFPRTLKAARQILKEAGWTIVRSQ